MIAQSFMFDRRSVTTAVVLLMSAPTRAAAHLNGIDNGAFTAIERKHGGRLGVIALDTYTGRTLAHRADERFLMCSSFKGVLAACVLARVDANLDRLDASVRYTAADLLPNSPVTAAHVVTGVLSVEALCGAILTQSDNAAANLLLARIGGPVALTLFVRRLGDRVTRFDRTEPALNRPLGELDTTTPAAMGRTLEKLYLGGTLKPVSLVLLERGMIGSVRGPMRLRASLPRTWTVGDRTGTSDAMCNDYAFARRPGRAPIAIAAYYEAPGLGMGAQEAVLRSVGALIAEWAI